MNENIKSGITFGLIGGLLTFLFGGWSVGVLGVLMGIGLGLALGPRFNRRDGWMSLAKQALPAAAVSCAILLLLSLLQNYVIDPAIGQDFEYLDVVIPANLMGVFGGILFTCATAALHGLSEEWERKGKLILLGLVIVAFPFVDKFTELRWTAQIIFALIFVILGLGLNIVVGYAGLLDLGYAAFFAIGAYTTGILSSPQHNIFLNFWLVIWIAAGVGAIFGLILGAPTLPLRGDYLAIVTLGFGEIVPVLFRNLIDVTIKEPLTCWILPLFKIQTACITFMSHEDLTAGEKGINPIGRPILPIIKLNEAIGMELIIKIAVLLIALALITFLYIRIWRNGNRKVRSVAAYAAILAIILIIFLPIPRTKVAFVDGFLNVIQPGEFQSDNPIPWYFLIIAIILLSIFLINRLRESRLGRAWMAIREDELAAAQMGIDPVRTKLLAFA
ncbi:MAG: hypothetical protein HY258_06000, partial [Chloroflexi bacterium]|nr:hypothetical protein [Chloroflexota bacterium]